MRTTSRSVPVERAVVWSAFVISVLIALVVLTAGIGALVTQLMTGQVSITLALDRPLPEGADLGRATLVGGSYDSASVVVYGLGSRVLTLSAATMVVGVLSQVAPIVTVAVLTWRLLRVPAFTKSLSLTVVVAGAVTVLCSVAYSGSNVLVAWMIAAELNPENPRVDGFWPIAANIDPGSIGLGFATMFVGLIFAYGERLQRDTEGLV